MSGEVVAEIVKGAGAFGGTIALFLFLLKLFEKNIIYTPQAYKLLEQDRDEWRARAEKAEARLGD